MPGVLVQVRAQTAANRLNIRRQLNMGTDPRLRFCLSDETQPNGVRVIREYLESFTRVIEAEREVVDGVSVIVDIADYPFPQGQLGQDIEDAQFITLLEDGVETDPFGDIDVSFDGMSLTYRLTAKTDSTKQTYYRAGHR
jgi:uncharacterized membrane-anchored protein